MAIIIAALIVAVEVHLRCIEKHFLVYQNLMNSARWFLQHNTWQPTLPISITIIVNFLKFHRIIKDVSFVSCFPFFSRTSDINFQENKSFRIIKEIKNN